MSLNSWHRQRVLALYNLFLLSCLSLIRRVCISDVRLTRLRCSTALQFWRATCTLSTSCIWISIWSSGVLRDLQLWGIHLNVCDVERVCQRSDGSGNRWIRYRRVLSFIIHKRHLCFLWCCVAGAYFWSKLVDTCTSSSNSLLGPLWTVKHQGEYYWRQLGIADLLCGDWPLRI